jgi:hypothetical protein
MRGTAASRKRRYDEVHTESSKPLTEDPQPSRRLGTDNAEEPSPDGREAEDPSRVAKEHKGIRKRKRRKSKQQLRSEESTFKEEPDRFVPEFPLTHWIDKYKSGTMLHVLS